MKTFFSEKQVQVVKKQKRKYREEGGERGKEGNRKVQTH